MDQAPSYQGGRGSEAGRSSPCQEGRGCLQLRSIRIKLTTDLVFFLNHNFFYVPPSCSFCSFASWNIVLIYGYDRMR